MKKSLIFLCLFILFLIPVYSQEENVTFSGNISELELRTGRNNNVLDLSEYFSSNKSIEYKYKQGGDGIAGLVIEIDNEGRVDIEASNPGIRSVIFLGDDDVNLAESNEVRLVISGVAIVEINFSPNSATLDLEEGKSQTFAVTGNESVKWFVDDVELNHTSFDYVYTGDIVGIHTIRVVSAGETKIWTVSVLSETIVNPTTSAEPDKPEGPVCGNGIRERGENCGNCVADVGCASNSECLNGICVPQKQSGSLRVVLWFVLLGAVIVFIVVGVILLRKKGIGEGLFSKIKRVFKKDKIASESEVKQVSKEENKKVVGQAKTTIKEETKNLNPLVSYFKNNLGKYKENELIKQALGQGWKQRQISEVLKKLRGKNGNATGNKKTPSRK